ncbi:hypothetical protein K8P10_001971 [Leucobacter sp. Psy1]|uniref:hypothetical protein n=1 Tax=Leucobacter sp. Psy1 TaxID=2875729 RepID=UPI001CD20689|nr:hypothetical protein [Leucobacter sp. Psy1]UBH06460.1 hypothetical protein K8P10_001971 [Leucobacter sp. Psy1]
MSSTKSEVQAQLERERRAKENAIAEARAWKETALLCEKQLERSEDLRRTLAAAAARSTPAPDDADPQPEESGPWTSHGHPIPGVTVVGARPTVPVQRCGGVRLCGACKREAMSYPGFTGAISMGGMNGAPQHPAFR